MTKIESVIFIVLLITTSFSKGAWAQQGTVASCVCADGFSISAPCGESDCINHMCAAHGQCPQSHVSSGGGSSTGGVGGVVAAGASNLGYGIGYALGSWLFGGGDDDGARQAEIERQNEIAAARVAEEARIAAEKERERQKKLDEDKQELLTTMKGVSGSTDLELKGIGTREDPEEPQLKSIDEKPMLYRMPQNNPTPQSIDAFAHVEQSIAALSHEGRLTEAQAQQLKELEQRRDELWRSLATSDLSVDERQRLRIRLESESSEVTYYNPVPTTQTHGPSLWDWTKKVGDKAYDYVDAKLAPYRPDFGEHEPHGDGIGDMERHLPWVLSGDPTW